MRQGPVPKPSDSGVRVLNPFPPSSLPPSGKLDSSRARSKATASVKRPATLQSLATSHPLGPTAPSRVPGTEEALSKDLLILRPAEQGTAHLQHFPYIIRYENDGFLHSRLHKVLYWKVACGFESQDYYAAVRPWASHLASLRLISGKSQTRFQAVTVDKNRYACRAWAACGEPESVAGARESLQGHPGAQSQPVLGAWHSRLPRLPHTQAPSSRHGSRWGLTRRNRVSPQGGRLLRLRRCTPSHRRSFPSPWAKLQKEMKCLGPRNLIQESGLRGWCSLLSRLSQGILFPKQNFLQYVKAQNGGKSKPCE